MTAPAPPTRDEELRLVAAAHAGDVAARNDLVRMHLPFVWREARAFAKRWHRLEHIDDLVAEGAIGLMHAIDRFDPSKGTRLLTYAVHWLRHNFEHYRERQATSFSGVFGSDADAVPGVARRLYSQHGPERAGELLRERFRARTLDLARVIGQGEERLDGMVCEGVTRADTLVAEGPSPEEAAVRHDDELRLMVRLDALLCRLAPREQEVLRARCMGDEVVTLAELGRGMGVSRERVRQIEARALKRMRKWTRPEGRRAP